MRYIPNFFVKIYEKSPVFTRSIASTLYGALKNKIELNNPLFLKYFKELEASQWWPLARIEEYQCDQLKKLIHHSVTNVLYYKKVFAEHGIVPSQIQTPDDLKKVPRLTKETIRRESKSLIANNIDIKKLRPETTSGTTGAPLTFWIDEKIHLQSKAFHWLQCSWAGYSGQEWIGILAGYQIIHRDRNKPPFWVTNYAGKQIHFSTYHLNPKFMPHYIRHIEKRKIKYLLGYPSAIGLLAEFMVRSEKKIRLKGIFLSSEPILENHRNAITKAFDCPVFDFYGQGERVLFAANCNYSTDLHLNMESGIAELSSFEAEPGKSKLVATSLKNYAMPLIRYEINDITKSAETEKPCPCGREHQMIGPIESRTGDYIMTPKGTIISPRLLSRILHNTRGIVASQIIQNVLDQLILNIVHNEFYNSEEEDMRLKKNIASCVGAEVKIEINKVDEIPLSKNGKHRFIISKIQIPQH